jgi:serine/threonine-protein kinase
MRKRAQGMPLAETLRHARQMAAGLLFAHERGVIHRDLKPENIFLVDSPGGPPVIKILDFGLAKSVLRTREPRLTRSGIVLGTPAYLAPEQAQNVELGPWTDQYAFALLVAEMLTGRKVRQDVTLAQIVTTEIARPLPAERVASAKPPPNVVAALQRATQPDPAQRFADVEDFVRALEDRPTRTRRERRISPGAVRIEHPRVTRRRTAWLVLAGLLVVAAAVAAWLLLQ